MKSLKKIITLHEAAIQSGYTQDYLGWLVRKGEIKAIKVGRNWCTTQQAIQEYLFKQKVCSGELALEGFFSGRRTHTIIAITLIVFVGVFYMTNAVYSKNNSMVSVNTTLPSDVEVIEILP